MWAAITATQRFKLPTFIHLVIIGGLTLGIGLWLGMINQDDTAMPINNCDANATWCNNQQSAFNLMVVPANTAKATNNPQLIHINVAGATLNSNEPLIGRISGGNMYMGQFDVFFKPNETGQLQALTSLPSCAETQPMVWKISLIRKSDTAAATADVLDTFFFSSPIQQP